MGKNFNTVTIIGLGVVGGSFALALSKIGYTVYGADIDPESCRSALQRGAVAQAAGEADAFLATSDLIIMALYPAQIKDYIANHIDKIRTGTVIIDVAGLKSHFTEEIESVLPNGVEFVFCHPMAGREKRGFAFADDRVLYGANFIITPTARTSREAIDKVRDLVREIGFGSIREISPAEHDETIAFTSQLPHALAVALINSDVAFEKTGAFIGDSYRDLTRIADINETLWSELFLSNRENLLKKIDAFDDELQAIRTAVERQDEEALRQLMIRSSRRRSLLNR